MNYGKIILADCANGVGLRTCLFVSGCIKHCPGCFNEVAWDFDYGEPYTAETEAYILSTLTEGIDGLTILGGEPFNQMRKGIKLLTELAKKTRAMGKTVWLYTGYTYETLMKVVPFFGAKELLKQVDVLVDGEFIEEEKDISLRFRGSKNQRIIDVQESLKRGEVVLWEE